MSRFPGRTGLGVVGGGPFGRRPKRKKIVQPAEDQVYQEFQDILGHLQGGDMGDQSILQINGGAEVIPQYDGVTERSGHFEPERGNTPDDALPEADLKSVPHDPSLQALWIAREIKKLAIYNEKHMHQPRAVSSSRATSVSPTFSQGASYVVNGHQKETPDSSLKSSRSSGRQRRQTSKAKEAHLVDLDVDEPLKLNDSYGDSGDGHAMLSALVTNQRIHHALSHSLNLGTGNYEKRFTFGLQFLQSMAADTIPPDPLPAQTLKRSLWRSRNNVPFYTALHILAAFEEVVQAIDVAFQGHLDDSTPLTHREAPQNHDNQIRGGGQFGSRIQPNVRSQRESNSFSTRMKLVHRESLDARPPALFSPIVFPGFGPDAGINAVNRPQSNVEPDVPSLAAEPESESEESVPHEVTSPNSYTPIDPNQTARAVNALNAATAILDDMAYGALKYFFPPSGPSTNQYLTPYGPPPPNTYVTPYTNSPPGQPRQVGLTHSESQQPLGGSQHCNVDVSSSTGAEEANFALPGSIVNGNSDGQDKSHAKDKCKEKSQEQVIGPDDVLASLESEKDTAIPAKAAPDASTEEVQDEDEDFTQIDSFLALAGAGVDSDSDSDSENETDRDKTISREMTPVGPHLGDSSIETILHGIIGELSTNQNWGHGIGFLTPQTHLYQISHAQRFAEGLKKCIHDARLGVNCVVSAEHSRAQEALYNAVIKRITNPYLDGTLPHYSNVVYHNGRAYQAIPGPAHPMYQQQLPYPPPPPPSAQMILPSQEQVPHSPQTDPRRRTSSSRPTSTRQTLRMIREVRGQRSASQTNSPEVSSRYSSTELPRKPLGTYRPTALINYESSESDHAPIVIRRPRGLGKRKRTSGRDTFTARPGSIQDHIAERTEE